MKRHFHLDALRLLVLGFGLLILSGAVLLSLPVASKNGESIPFLNALFTAASASCVTGLVVYDTYTQFTLFGQAVLLLLIQIGGLGFMTFSILGSFLLGRRIGLRQRALLMDTVGSLKIGGVVRLTRRALLVTACFEGVGATVLSVFFIPRFGFFQGLWMGVFHAVSAFCNAGFDLMGIQQPGSSMTTLAGAVTPNVVLMALIVAGGLGFFLWDDLIANRGRVRCCRLHTKLVLFSTALLLVGGTVAFYALERRHAFAGVPAGQQWLMAAFQSVSPRTAGFNTVELTALRESSTLLTILLMFVGAGSGSTGGGVKVNTFAVLVLAALATIRRRRDIDVFHRRLDEASVQKAYSTAGVYVFALLCGCMVLCLQNVGLEDALFEAVSAIGTVGITRGITPTLSAVSKAAVILMMFAGRVGSLSVVMAVIRSNAPVKVRNISEKILIG